MLPALEHKRNAKRHSGISFVSLNSGSALLHSRIDRPSRECLLIYAQYEQHALVTEDCEENRRWSWAMADINFRICFIFVNSVVLETFRTCWFIGKKVRMGSPRPLRKRKMSLRAASGRCNARAAANQQRIKLIGKICNFSRGKCPNQPKRCLVNATKVRARHAERVWDSFFLTVRNAEENENFWRRHCTKLDGTEHLDAQSRA